MAGGEAVAAMVAAVVVVVAVAAVHTAMRTAVGMAAHGTTPARGHIGATAIATANRRHRRIVGVARCGQWQVYLQMLLSFPLTAWVTVGVAIIVTIAFSSYSSGWRWW